MKSISHKNNFADRLIGLHHLCRD